MQTSTLITILIILLLILIPLLLSYLVYPDEKVNKHLPKLSKKIKKEEPVISKNEILSFEEIATIFSHKKSTKEDLVRAIEQLIRHHGKIQAKLGDLPHPDFKRYLILIIELCNNPQVDKDIIVSLDNKLRTKNPKYGINIDEAINKGIARRGF